MFLHHPPLLLSAQVVPEEFESSISEPESDVLPLHHGTIHLELQPHPKKANQAMLLARLRCKGTIKIRKGNTPTDFLLHPFLPPFSKQKGRGREPEFQKRISRKALRLLPNILQKTAHETFYSCPKKEKAQGSKIRAFHS